MQTFLWRWLSLLLLLAIPLSPAAAQIRPGDAEEEANCARLSQMVEANAAPVLQELERLARQRFGRRFDELTPEQMMQLTRVARVEGRQETAEQERMARRCDAYRQRTLARQSAAAGLGSLSGAAYFLERWGREQVMGLGCTCPDFRLGGEGHDQRCPSRPLCPGQQGGPRIPDPVRGCRSLGAAAWISRQLPGYFGILGIGEESEAMRDALAARNRPAPPPACGSLPQPTALPLSAAALSGGAGPAPAATAVAPAAIAAASACFAKPTPASCERALVQGDELARAARRASRDRCLGYALAARTLWALGADPAFTDLLVSFPAASRLRNEARIALGYLRNDCRGL
jgi:hypothetical protein